MVQNWPKAEAFYERVDRLGLHGLHFQHVTLCERRAWLYLHHVNFAQWHDRVKTGTAVHRTRYMRDRSTEGLFGLAPDRLDWGKAIVYENKGTAGAREASNNQTAFYAVMLSLATGRNWRAVTHILSTRRNRDVPFNAHQLQALWNASMRLEVLAATHEIPSARRIRLCNTCSAAVFCGYDHKL